MSATDALFLRDTHYAWLKADDTVIPMLPQVAHRVIELVSDPDAVEGAIARCLAAVRGGRSAILHAKVTKL